MPKVAKKIKKKTRRNKINSTELIVDNQNATSFGGLAIAREMLIKLSMWHQIMNELLQKARGHDRRSVVIGALMGFLSGSFGVHLLEDIRNDKALCNHFEIDGLPSPKNFWEELGKLGDDKILTIFNQILRTTARKLLRKVPVEQIQIQHGFIPLFGDGTLLECSKGRDGAKYITGKGYGLMWSNWYMGSVLVGQHLCKEGEGEPSSVKNMLDDIVQDIIKPLGRKKEVLVLMDSLHGNEPVLNKLEQNGLYYIIGGMAL